MPPKAGQSSYQTDLERLEQLAAAPVSRSEQLARNLQHMYEAGANAEFADYDVATIAKVAPSVMYRLFDLRVGLRNRIADFEAARLMTPDVVQGLRDVFRVVRYISDMLGEIAIGNARLPPDGQPLRGFTGADTNTLINWAFYNNAADLPFRAGDVILVRGRAHNSAAIARIGDVDSQFSHVGIVHEDASGKLWSVESLIEDGAVVQPLGAALDHNIARAVLYRHRDAELAARAAERIHDYVAASRKAFRRRIWYDFSMRLDDRRSLFCSKLVRLAFDKGSDGRYRPPRYPTRIGLQNRDFLDRIGVKAQETFAPGDIDLESSFDLVAEWQDFRETPNIRLQDFTMDKVFEWMARDGYRFQETAAVRLISRLGRLSSYLSDDAKYALSSIFPRVPRNMRRKTVAAVAMLHQTAEPIYRELQELQREHIVKTGVPMHGLVIAEALERIRAREGDSIGYLVRG